MKAEHYLEVDGKKIRLSMPMGGFERLKGLGEYPLEITQSFVAGVVSASEVRDVLEVALDLGGSGITVGQLEEHFAFGDLRAACVDLLKRATEDDSGNFNAAMYPLLSAPGSGSDPTS